MEHLIIFIAAVIVAAALVYHLTVSLIMRTGNIPYPPYYQVYPMYAWIIALAVILYVVWETSFFVVGSETSIFSPKGILFMVIVIPADLAITREWFINFAEIIKKSKTHEMN